MLSSYYEQDGITIYHARCEDVLPSLSGFDAVVTDPPYGIPHTDATWHKRKRDRQDGNAKAARKNYGDIQLPKADADTIGATIAAGSAAIIWGGNFFALPPSSCWLVWDKDNGANDFADCELAWTNLPKAVRKFRWRWNGMLQERGGDKKEHRVHPTQKPLALMKWCLSLVSDAKTVLDPFMGSGTTLVAAKAAGMRAVGIEINEEYCQKAVERLRQGVLPFAG